MQAFARRLRIICVLAIMLVADGAFGQSAPRQDDFAPRRVVVPNKPSGARITVQIDPIEQARRLGIAPKVQTGQGAPIPSIAPPSVESSDDSGWFWDLVPTSQEARTDRFDLAIASLTNGPGGIAIEGPRLQSLQDLSAQYGIEILKATIGTDVSPALVLAIMGLGDAQRPNSLENVGGLGLMHLAPAILEQFEVQDADDPVQNIKGGIAYLNRLMTVFDRDPLMVLAAYNAGEEAVTANAGIPPFPETRRWVPRALAAWQVAQGLCMTPPELMSDPCVFRVLAAGQKN